MSLLISGIRLPFDAPEESAIAQALSVCGLRQAPQASVWRVSIDARHGKISRVYTVRLDGVENEEAFAEKLQMPLVRYQASAQPFDVTLGTKKMQHRPVIAGLGPAGLFAAYTLAQHGYAPIVLERGADMDRRDKAVDAFWKTSQLSPRTNIQFGEGGAGAYSDGKLTTRIGDARCEQVLQTFIAHGAPNEISMHAKPHIGTDLLKGVVKRMREQIVQWGGSVQFDTRLTAVRQKNGALCAILTEAGEIPAEQLILAVGHSARDTFVQMHENGVFFEPKAFSVGARIEHLQSEIDRALYGTHAGHPLLPPAEYSLSHRKNGRACYSFCMCPGGMVVAAQSEENSVVTNGMSYHARNGKNANAALAVSVLPEDFADGTPFGGVQLQRQIERAAYACTGSYQAPCQTVSDFLRDRKSTRIGTVSPTYPLGVQLGSIVACLPEYATRMLRESLPVFGRKIRGFDADDALLTAPETRTSSPVRMTRGGDLYSISMAGVIPCGEGAGYAGGIMSAAVDGMRAAERIMEEFAPIG